MRTWQILTLVAVAIVGIAVVLHQRARPPGSPPPPLDLGDFDRPTLGSL